MLIAEVYSDVDDVMRYYGNDTVPLADFPFNFFILDSLMNRSAVTGESLKETVNLWLDNLPPNKWPNWVVSLHSLLYPCFFLQVGVIYAVSELVMLLTVTGTIAYKSINMSVQQWIRYPISITRVLKQNTVQYKTVNHW